GILASSISLIADAIHSATDSISSAIVIAGFKIAAKPPDREHPYGHGRAELIATLIIAVLIIVTGVEFIKSGIDRLLNPQPVSYSVLVIIAVGITIIVKELLGKFSLELGEAIDSDTLKADAWHHRSDALSSVVVIIALLLSPRGFIWADGIGAMIVAIILIKVGIELTRSSVDDLLGKAPDASFLEKLRQLVRDIPKVENAHDIVVHQYGQSRHIGLHIEISAAVPPMEAHELVEKVEQTIRKTLKADATVHYDPIPVDDARIPDVWQSIEKLQNEIPELIAIHDLRIVDSHSKVTLLMDLVTEFPADSQKALRLKNELTERLKVDFPYEVHIHLTPIHKSR
ncbi:MAG TPA: cation transporter, partial [Candidatus Marinimicrobia bacterium]|nr:cation transporter [Candidatus Neomarinimicrobiota bacterium]